MGLVHQLQEAAMDSSVPVTDLLRKALVVARKLKINEFEEWILRELEGYSEDINIEKPTYRKVTGEVRAYNPIRGYVPALIMNPDYQRLLTERHVTMSIGEIEALFLDSGAARGSLYIPYSPEVEAELIGSADYPCKPLLFVNPAQVRGILDTVRNTILKWSLKLEADGIIGEGLTFSMEEEKRAQVLTYSIQNYIAHVSNSTVQQGTVRSNQINIDANIDFEKVAALVSQIKSKISELGVNGVPKADLDAEIGTIESQLSSSKPKVPVVRQCLESIRTILEGAAGSALGSVFLDGLSKLLK